MKFCRILAVGLVGVLGLSCENDPPEPNEPIRVLGTVGSDFLNQAGPNSVAQALGGRVPDTVAAISIIDGPVETYREVSIAADGSFELEVDTAYDRTSEADETNNEATVEVLVE